MTELINAAVTHKIFGAGKITNLKNGTIIIQFESAEKKFLYPEVFKKLLVLEDAALLEKINETIKITEMAQVSKEQTGTMEKILTETSPENLNHTDLYGLEPLKIGAIVQTVFRRRFENGQVDSDEIELMQTKAYSRETFHLQYSVLLKAKHTGGNRPMRYYKNPLKIGVQTYYLCSEWFEVPANNDRPFLRTIGGTVLVCRFHSFEHERTVASCQSD